MKGKKPRLEQFLKQRHIPMLDRFGNIIEHLPQYKGLKIYPPLKTLAVEEISS